MRDDLPTYDPRRSRSLHPQNQVWRGETACERRPKLTRGTTAALKKVSYTLSANPRRGELNVIELGTVAASRRRWLHSIEGGVVESDSSDLSKLRQGCRVVRPIEWLN